MTYLIIGQDTKQQEIKVADMISSFFGKTITDISEFIQYPDIHTLDGREQNSIGIEEVKNFQNEMVFKPFQEDVQIGIIWESEKLTPQAQNSFLKTLEESNDQTIFLLCVNNEKSLLQTIISRSKPIYLSSSPTEKISPTQPYILTLDRVGQFQEIENISKDKTTTIELINEIEQYYKFLLTENIKNTDIKKAQEIKEKLKEIDSSRVKAASNCNKRMLLENLVIHL